MRAPRIIPCHGCGTVFTVPIGRGWNNRTFCDACHAHPDREKRLNRSKNLLRLHGLTLYDFDAMLHKQGGECAICKVPLNTLFQRVAKGERRDPTEAVVDHDHTTGRVRSILCHSCNIALGHIRDNPKTAVAIYEYLTAQQGA